MYYMDVWRFSNSTEYEVKFLGRHGAKGEKRAARKKPTPEQVKKQNQRNREKAVRRLLKANFRENDYWVTLKYPRGTRICLDGVKKDMRKFLGKLRAGYRKAGSQLKFIYRIEIGKRGGIHIHIMLNRIEGVDILVKSCWVYGGVHFTLAYGQGGFRNLAGYLVKEAEGEGGGRRKQQYSTSRNLVRPQPERKVYFRRTVRRMVEEGPKPTPGFRIVEDSIVSGVNQYTGMSYIHYEEERIVPAKEEGGVVNHDKSE